MNFPHLGVKELNRKCNNRLTLHVFKLLWFVLRPFHTAKLCPTIYSYVFGNIMAILYEKSSTVLRLQKILNFWLSIFPPFFAFSPYVYRYFQIGRKSKVNCPYGCREIDFFIMSSAWVLWIRVPFELLFRQKKFRALTLEIWK